MCLSDAGYGFVVFDHLFFKRSLTSFMQRSAKKVPPRAVDTIKGAALCLGVERVAQIKRNVKFP